MNSLDGLIETKCDYLFFGHIQQSTRERNKPNRFVAARGGSEGRLWHELSAVGEGSAP